MMLVRLACGLALGVAVVSSSTARAGCAEEISQLMSKDTEKLTSRYNQITRRIERDGATPNLQTEECRIARQLEPQLASQIAALKQSNCRRDPSVASMVADIVRGHEDDLAALRKVTAQVECK